MQYVNLRAECKKCNTKILINLMPGSYYFGPQIKCGVCEDIILQPVIQYKIFDNSEPGNEVIDLYLTKIV